MKPELTREYLYSDLQTLAASKCKGRAVLVFSVFKESPNDTGDIANWLVMAPDLDSTEPAINGKVVLQTSYWRITDSTAQSPVLTDPTWADIINAVNHIMAESGTVDGVFFEGLRLERQDDGVDYYHITIGS